MQYKKFLVFFSLLIFHIPVYAAVHKLYVRTIPKYAKVQILNINPKFRQGIKLLSGRYKLKIEKNCYVSKMQWVTIRNRNRDITVKLISERHKLHVTTTPKNAKVRILSIKPKFKQNMSLKCGRYKIEVSSSGYQTQIQLVKISNQDISTTVNLAPLLEPQKLYSTAISKTVLKHPKNDSPKLNIAPIPAPVPDHFDKDNSGVAVNTTPASNLAKDDSSRPNINPMPEILRDYLKDGGFGPEMVVIPTPYSQISDKASIDKISRLAIGKYEITFAEYDKFVTATGGEAPNDNGWGRNDRPAINVSWDDANAYTKWLSQQTGQKYRLPTEVEWEYTARAFTSTTRYWGNNPNNACVYANVHDNTSKSKNGYNWPHHNCTDGYAKTAPVGQFTPNTFGLFDMLGNVWELVANDSANEGKQLLRGGSWSVSPQNCHAEAHIEIAANKKLSFVGFRVVTVR